MGDVTSTRQLGLSMVKRSWLRGCSCSLFEHVGSKEPLEVSVPQICPLGLVDGKFFLSSRRLSRFLWGCSLEVGFRQYRFTHRCACYPCGYGVLLFFVAGICFHNFVQGEIYVLSFGVRRIGFCKFKRASRSMRLRFMLGVLLETFWLSFSTWFSYWFLDSFWVPFGAHLGFKMDPKIAPKTV